MAKGNTDLSCLSSNQLETLRLAASGQTSKEIARILDISPHTVDQRLSLARKKVNVQDRRALVAVYNEYAAICDHPIYGPEDLDRVSLPVQFPVQSEFGGSESKAHPKQIFSCWQNFSHCGAVWQLEMFRIGEPTPLRVRELLLVCFLFLFLILNLYEGGRVIVSFFK